MSLGLFIFVLSIGFSSLSSQGQINPITLTSNYDPTATTGIFENQPISVPPIDNRVLGDSNLAINLPNSNLKHIEVDLTTQHLYAFENGQPVFDFLISSGKYDRTPNGTFYIWTKIKSQRMKGGSKELGTYYDLPNVPNILFFYNEATKKEVGYSIHGTYWHHNFGVPMSHGCINMFTPESLLVYNWADVGTSITIYGKYSPLISQK